MRQRYLFAHASKRVFGLSSIGNREGYWSLASARPGEGGTSDMVCVRYLASVRSERKVQTMGVSKKDRALPDHEQMGDMRARLEQEDIDRVIHTDDSEDTHSRESMTQDDLDSVIGANVGGFTGGSTSARVRHHSARPTPTREKSAHRRMMRDGGNQGVSKMAGEDATFPTTDLVNPKGSSNPVDVMEQSSGRKINRQADPPATLGHETEDEADRRNLRRDPFEAPRAQTRTGGRRVGEREQAPRAASKDSSLLGPFRRPKHVNPRSDVPLTPASESEEQRSGRRDLGSHLAYMLGHAHRDDQRSTDVGNGTHHNGDDEEAGYEVALRPPPIKDLRSPRKRREFMMDADETASDTVSERRDTSLRSEREPRSSSRQFKPGAQGQGPSELVRSVKTAVAEGSRSRVRDLLREKFKSEVPGTPKEFTACISAVAKQGWWETALKILSMMKQNNVELNVFAYSAAMNACVKGGHWEEALELLVEMSESGITPNLISYNNALRAFQKGGQWSRAVELINEMPTQGVQPDCKSYTAVIGACGPGNQWQKALELLKHASENNVKPDLMMYSSAISACAHGRVHKPVFNLLREMREKGLQPDVVCYSAAISACGEAREWEKGIKLLREMSNEGVKPNVVTYTAAIEVYGKSHKWEEAVDLLGEMYSLGLQPTVWSYNAAIVACGDCGQWKQAVKLLREISETGLEPERTSFVFTMKACEQAGQAGEAETVIAEAEARGFKITNARSQEAPSTPREDAA